MFLFRSSHWSLPSSNGSKVRRCAIWSLYFSDPGSSCAGLGRATEERSWKIIFQDSIISKHSKFHPRRKTSELIRKNFMSYHIPMMSIWNSSYFWKIFTRVMEGAMFAPAPAGHFKSRMPHCSIDFWKKTSLPENLTNILPSGYD